jgi:6-phosphofructokinase 1
LSDEEIIVLKQTPASTLGSCRYKLKRSNLEDFKKIFEVLQKHNIETMFYVGGNDSMDTVAALSEYAK